MEGRRKWGRKGTRKTGREGERYIRGREGGRGGGEEGRKGGRKRKREREGSREGGRKDGFSCLTWVLTVLLRLILKLGLKGSFHFCFPSSRRQARLAFLQESYWVVFHAPNLLRDGYITITSIEYIILCCVLFRFTNNFNTMVRIISSSHLHELLLY